MAANRSGADRSKLVFFSALVIASLWVIWNDERFLVRADDPHWQVIAPFKQLLLVHGLFGAIALALGATQFSSHLRRRPGLHRWTGRIYLGCVVVASLFAGYIGSHFEPVTIRVEQYFQSGGWLISTLIGWWYIRRRNVASHRLWMMRSYAFALIFLTSRLPDGMPGFAWNDQLLSDVLWGLVVTAFVVPEFIVKLIAPARWPPELLPQRADTGGQAPPTPA